MEKDPKQRQQQQKKKQNAMANNTEASSFVEENGKMSMKADNPTGWNLMPTEDELVVDYLKNKILGKPLPCNIITSVNIYKCSPQQLTDFYPSNGLVWYFFTPGYQYHERSKGNNSNRAAGDGYWKPTGGRTVIYNKGQKVGFKKAFTFLKTNVRLGTVQTKWRMHEYRVDHVRVPGTSRATDDIKFDDWVLCKIYKMAVKEENNLAQDNEGKMMTVTDEGVPNAEVKPDQDSALGIVVELLSFLDLLDTLLGDDDAKMESDTVSDTLVQNQTETRDDLKLESDTASDTLVQDQTGRRDDLKLESDTVSDTLVQNQTGRRDDLKLESDTTSDTLVQGQTGRRRSRKKSKRKNQPLKLFVA